MSLLFQSILASLLFAALSACASAAPRYDLYFEADLQPKAGTAKASIRIDQPRALVTQLALRMPQAQFSNIQGDGEQERQGDILIWRVPVTGGELSYQYKVENRRANGAFDAQLTPDGGLFRGDDLFPAATLTTNELARSKSWVAVQGPKGWSVETQYGNTAEQAVRFVHPKRRYDRPTGWMLAGPLGIRREEIADRSVVVAAVRGQRLRRNDILAFLRWNMPALIEATGSFPKRLLIVGADDPFWRGGLSGTQSLYLHSDRPLIGEDGTSTLLHELMHVATSLRAVDGDDWIVEGIAEFYSLEIMRRTGTLSEKRFQASIEGLEAKGRTASGLNTSRSAGATTALAVSLFYELDQELKSWQQQNGQPVSGLDVLLRRMIEREAEPISLQLLAQELQSLGLAESTILKQMRKHKKSNAS